MVAVTALTVLLVACSSSPTVTTKVITDLSGIYTGTLSDQDNNSDFIDISFRLFEDTEANTSSSTVPYFANFTLIGSDLSSLLDCLYNHETLEEINLICQNKTQEFSFLLSATETEITGTGILVTSKIYTVDVNLER